MIKPLGCRITLDNDSYDCSSWCTRKENLRGAWLLLWVDYGGKNIPKTKEEFERRGGKIEWFKSYNSVVWYDV